MNEVLKYRDQIDAATQWLTEHGYVTHPISAKDWELKLITESIGDGDLIDLGADGSRVLHNAIIKKIKGRKVGIDLAEVTGDNKAEGAEYFQGDLMKTPFEDESFDTVVSQSVIEHEVNLNSFAAECSRILKPRGKLIVSFDYWPEKINTEGMNLYGLKWNILDVNGMNELIEACFLNGLNIKGNLDWEAKDAVINPSYCSPYNVSYTFFILEFIKNDFSGTPEHYTTV